MFKNLFGNLFSRNEEVKLRKDIDVHVDFSTHVAAHRAMLGNYITERANQLEKEKRLGTQLRQENSSCSIWVKFDNGELIVSCGKCESRMNVADNPKCLKCESKISKELYD